MGVGTTRGQAGQQRDGEERDDQPRLTSFMGVASWSDGVDGRAGTVSRRRGRAQKAAISVPGRRRWSWGSKPGARRLGSGARPGIRSLAVPAVDPLESSVTSYAISDAATFAMRRLVSSASSAAARRVKPRRRDPGRHVGDASWMAWCWAIQTRRSFAAGNSEARPRTRPAPARHRSPRRPVGERRTAALGRSRARRSAEAIREGTRHASNAMRTRRDLAAERRGQRPDAGHVGATTHGALRRGRATSTRPA
jgi:hypothetical protein